jgi:[protein-PII] uridylyltransferase
MSARTDVSPGSHDAQSACDAPNDFVARFMASMPVRYRVLFDPRTVRRHATVAYRRIGRPVGAEVWRTLADGTSELCVVADDRPGLLLLIAAVLAAHHLDVMSALLFSRASDEGRDEAVDLFWVRRFTRGDTAPLGADETAAIADRIAALVSGATSLDEIAPDPASPAASGAPIGEVTVRFEENDDEGTAALTVDATDAPALLYRTARTLYGEGVQIVRSLVRTVDGKVHNRFDLLERDGGPLSAERRDAIRIAVAATLRSPPRG